MSQIWYPSINRHLCYVLNFKLISLFCHIQVVESPKFCCFWTLAFYGVANWQHMEKAECGCTTTNHIQWQQNCFCTPTPSLSFKSVTSHKQTDKQTKKSTFLAVATGHAATGEIQAPPYLAWWWRTSCKFLHLQNFWGSDAQFHHSSKPRCKLKFLGKPITLNLKPP